MRRLFRSHLVLCLLLLSTVRVALAHRADSGKWSAEFTPGSPEIRLSMRFEDASKGTNQSDMNERVSAFTNMNFKVGELNPKAHFELTREAGTFFFDGVVNDTTGAGAFMFKPDPTYANKMKGLGINVGADDLVNCGLFDVSSVYVKQIRAEGYNPDLEKLIELRIFHVDRASIADLQKLKGSRPTMDELVEAKIFGVTSDFAKQAQQFGFGPLTMDDLTAFRIHGVDAKFLNAMKEVGYSGFSADDAVAMRIHGVTPEFVRELKSLGYTGLQIDELVEMRIFGVDPAFIRQQQKAGRAHLSVEELVERKRMKEEKRDMI